MVKKLQLHRGTETLNNAYTGLSGEITADLENKELRLHDGVTAGGTKIGGLKDGSVTDVKVAANAEIAQSKIAGLVDDLEGKADVSALDSKQDTLTAGDNITIINNVISAELTVRAVTHGTTLTGDGLALNPLDGGISNVHIADNASIAQSKISGLVDDLADKVDVVAGKGLSENDLTDTLKNNYDAAYSHSTTSGNPHGTTKSDIGLGNVDNTSDADKPISNAVASVLLTKANDNTVAHLAGQEIFTDGKGFAKGAIFYGQVATFPSGLGTYVTNYVSSTYNVARVLAYDGTAYQDLAIGAMPTVGKFAFVAKVDGTLESNYGLKLNDLTASTVPYLDSNKKITSSAITPTELGCLSGITSNIQSQINSVGGKTKLSANISFYIDMTNGSDSNTGLSAGSQVKTWAKLIDIMYNNYNYNNYVVTINGTNITGTNYLYDAYLENAADTVISLTTSTGIIQIQSIRLPPYDLLGIYWTSPTQTITGTGTYTVSNSGLMVVDTNAATGNKINGISFTINGTSVYARHGFTGSDYESGCITLPVTKGDILVVTTFQVDTRVRIFRWNNIKY